MFLNIKEITKKKKRKTKSKPKPKSRVHRKCISFSPLSEIMFIRSYFLESVATEILPKSKFPSTSKVTCSRHKTKVDASNFPPSPADFNSITVKR